MLTIKDSRGKKSTTLGFITLAFYTITLAFLYTAYKSGAADLLAYGGAVTAVLSPWVGREFVDTKRGSKDDV